MIIIGVAQVGGEAQYLWRALEAEGAGVHAHGDDRVAAILSLQGLYLLVGLGAVDAALPREVHEENVLAHSRGRHIFKTLVLADFCAAGYQEHGGTQYVQ